MLASKRQSKKRLAVPWFIGPGFAFMIVLVQTIMGRYRPAEDSVWSWFLPTVVPTFSLMIGVFVADALGSAHADRRVDECVYNIAFGVSVAYFLIIYVTILIQPFSGQSPIDLMKQSNF